MEKKSAASSLLVLARNQPCFPLEAGLSVPGHLIKALEQATGCVISPDPDMPGHGFLAFKCTLTEKELLPLLKAQDFEELLDELDQPPTSSLKRTHSMLSIPAGPASDAMEINSDADEPQDHDQEQEGDQAKIDQFLERKKRKVAPTQEEKD